jgi:hypothetical protein
MESQAIVDIENLNKARGRLFRLRRSKDFIRVGILTLYLRFNDRHRISR